MELSAIITAVIVNILGVGGMIFYSGRKIGTICARLDTLSTNHSSMIMAVNQLSSRVRELEIRLAAFYRTRLQSGEGPKDG